MLMSDHVHILIAIPPAYAVAQGIGFIREERDPFGTGVWRGSQDTTRWILANCGRKLGGPPGDRTRDTLIKSQVLYH